MIVTAPLILVSNTMATMSAFSTEGGNMNCYADPEIVGEQMSMRWVLMLILLYFSVFSTRTYLLNDYLQKKLEKRQQEFLQNVFDNQSDGVIILSKPLPKPIEKKQLPKKKLDGMPEDADDKEYEGSDLEGEQT